MAINYPEHPDRECCWHHTRTLTSNPPITVETCCWCGEKQYERPISRLPEHGSHA